MELFPDQQKAMDMVKRNRVCILTGAPGTGKTFTIKTIINSFPNSKIALAAPTGKGSKRMYEQSGMKAMTIHNLLLAMLRKYENVKKPCKIKVIGLQPGENMHETLGQGQDSDVSPQYTVNQILKLI